MAGKGPYINSMDDFTARGKGELKMWVEQSIQKSRVVSTGGGAQGPPGPAGPAGPPGTPGPGGTFVFTQGTPSASWLVTHNLNAYPSATVVDTGNSEVIPTIVYNDSNHLTLTFGSPTTGRAFLN